MFTRKFPGIVLALGLGSSAAFSAGPNLGTPIEPAEIAAWDISIQPTARACRSAAARPHKARASTRRSASCATV